MAYFVTQARVDFNDAKGQWSGELGRSLANGVGGSANCALVGVLAHMLLLSVSFVAWASTCTGWAQQDVLG